MKASRIHAAIAAVMLAGALAWVARAGGFAPLGLSGAAW